MQLLDLPNEILQICCPKTGLKKLRLTCKHLAMVASKPLFSHVRLWPTSESAEKLQAILNDSSLARMVNSITLHASLEGPGHVDVEAAKPIWDLDLGANGELTGDGSRSRGEYGIEHEAEVFDGWYPYFFELSSTFKQTLSQIGRLQNIRRLEVIFNDHVSKRDPILLCKGPYPADIIMPRKTDEMSDSVDLPVELLPYRTKLLKTICRALNHPQHPATGLRELTIMNLQDVVDVQMAASDDFRAVLSRLDSLELRIATHEDDHPW